MLQIGKTSFSKSAVEALKGKTVEEILKLRPGMNPRVAEEFVKLNPVKKAKSKPKAKKEKDKE